MQPAEPATTLDLRAAPGPSTRADSRATDPGDPYATADPDRTQDLAPAPAPPRRAEGLPGVPGYELLDVLGRGGMGVVYRAIQVRANRPVALKMILGDAHACASQLDRFRVEAESVAALRHPNIVQIYDVGEVDGLPYFSLELLEGGTLAARLAGTPMPPREAAGLLATLAAALHSAHSAGIVHRDLKPANILFDLDGSPRVADFGLAKRLEDHSARTMTGQVMGTPSYMAPEQARGEVRAIGPAADVYSLGAILYEALTGRPPFRGASVPETLLMVLRQDPVPPSRLRPGLPRDPGTICLKCLAKEPGRRYATAADLAADLGRYLAGEPIRARPISPLGRAAKWAGRRPVAALGVAFSLVAAVGLAVGAIGRERALVRLGLEAVAALDLGGDQVDRGDLVAAQATLTALRARLEREPRLADLRRRADEAAGGVGRELAARAGRVGARARLEEFRKERTAALFALARFDDLGRDGDPSAARAAARAALVASTPAALPPGTISAEERAEVESDRRLVVMALSEAIARPLPGEDPSAQADAALELLDAPAAGLDRGPAFHLRRASCLDRRGDPRGAAAERDRAAGLPPASAFDFLLLGQESSLARDWDRARSHLEAAIRLEPSLFWAHGLLAIAQLQAVPPRAAEARSELNFCLASRADYPGLYLLRGTANGQQAAALLAASRPGLPLAAEAEARFEDAEADFARALGLGLGADLGYALRMNRGAMRFQRKRPGDSAADFRAAIALDPARYNAHASLAQALRALGRPDEAAAEFGEAIAREPGLAALYHGRAQARIGAGVPEAGRADAALADLGRAADLEPPGSRAAAGLHAERAALLIRLGRPREALRAADSALALAGDLPRARLARASALIALESYPEAVAACDAALVAQPLSAELYRCRALARARSGDVPGAIDDATRALGLAAEGRGELLRLRGWWNLFEGSPEMALRDFDSLVRLDRDSPEGLAGRASALVGLGRLREAVADADESVRRGRPDPSLLYAAARTYALASARSAAEIPRRGRPAIRDSAAYEARAADLLRRAIEQTPADGRAAFRDDVVARDAALRPLLRDRRTLRCPGPTGANPP